MTRVVYVNGRYEPYDQARVHCEDRGYQFGDAVYEVIEVRDGALVDETRHMQRLARSLRELDIAEPMRAEAWSRVIRETVRRNRVRDGIVYLQVSRGVGPRDFLFPKPGTPPSVVCLARAVPKRAGDAKADKGLKVITERDPRWARCDIKTVMLLPASLAKERARATGADDVWFVDADGFVTEGGSNNAWIVTAEGGLVTTPNSPAILPGITRSVVIDLARAQGLVLEERRFTVSDALAAREAFVTSATSLVMPVVEIDGNPIGNGAPGLLASRLRTTYHSEAEMVR